LWLVSSAAKAALATPTRARVPPFGSSRKTARRVGGNSRKDQTPDPTVHLLGPDFESKGRGALAAAVLQKAETAFSQNSFDVSAGGFTGTIHISSLATASSRPHRLEIGLFQAQRLIGVQRATLHWDYVPSREPRSQARPRDDRLSHAEVVERTNAQFPARPSPFGTMHSFSLALSFLPRQRLGTRTSSASKSRKPCSQLPLAGGRRQPRLGSCPLHGRAFFAARRCGITTALRGGIRLERHLAPGFARQTSVEHPLLVSGRIPPSSR